MRWDLAYWLERLTANAPVATVLGSIPASVGTVESKGRQMKQCWIRYEQKKKEKNPPKNIKNIIAYTGKAIPTIQSTPLEIIFNKTHPSVKLHIKEKPIQNIVAHLMQEIKRDIIYRRMNANANQRERNLTRIRAHLLSATRKTLSLFEYQGTKNHQESLNFLTLLETTINDRV